MMQWLDWTLILCQMIHQMLPKLFLLYAILHVCSETIPVECIQYEQIIKEFSGQYACLHIHMQGCSAMLLVKVIASTHPASQGLKPYKMQQPIHHMG